MLRAGQNVLVIGAGVVGVATAFSLARAGFHVTVLERNAGPAAETSFANGAQLSYAYNESIASPSSLKQMLGWMLKPESPVILKYAPRTAEFADWAFRYLRAALPGKSTRYSADLLRLGLHSRSTMQAWLRDVPIDFDHQENGILYLYRNKAAMKEGVQKVTIGQAFGFNTRVVSLAEAKAIEHCLNDTQTQLEGAVYSPMDATGDPYLFTQAMAEHARNLGVKIQYGVTLTQLIQRNGRIVGASDGAREWLADAVVLAAGSFSQSLVRDLPIRLPIQPMKGYSLTFDAGSAESAPRASITDVGRRLVHTRIGNRVRIAGFAEFAGADSAVRPEPLAQLARDAQRLVPHYTFENASQWACLRAASADGLPVIGASAAHGLWLNTGHGMLGWTQAAGSADLLTRQMLGQPTPIPMEGYAHARF